MPKGYWVVRMDIDDAEKYTESVAANAAAFTKYGARVLVRGGKFELFEGSTRGRNVVIEFPSYQAALDCWHSPEYKPALKIRKPISDGDIVIVEGYDGPQPS